MATIHIEEIRRILFCRGEQDAMPGSPEGMFLEIRFDKPDALPTGTIDPEYKNEAITVESHYGLATIQFDEEGQLRSIDIS